MSPVEQQPHHAANDAEDGRNQSDTNYHRQEVGDQLPDIGWRHHVNAGDGKKLTYQNSQENPSFTIFRQSLITMSRKIRSSKPSVTV